MAEKQRTQHEGYVESVNDHGLKLRGIEGPSNGYFNYSKPDYRDAPWDSHGKGDYVYLEVTDSGFIKAIRRHGSVPEATAAPPAAPPPPLAGVAPPPPPGPPGPDEWPTERPAPPPYVDPDKEKNISIGRQVSIKVAGELWPLLPEAWRGKTPEAAAQDVAVMARIFHAVIEE